jgi:hypothetical protein
MTANVHAVKKKVEQNTIRVLFALYASLTFVWSESFLDALTPEEQTARFGNDAGQARDFLKSQARNQIIKKWGVRVGLGVIAC